MPNWGKIRHALVSIWVAYCVSAKETPKQSGTINVTVMIAPDMTAISKFIADYHPITVNWFDRAWQSIQIYRFNWKNSRHRFFGFENDSLVENSIQLELFSNHSSRRKCYFEQKFRFEWARAKYFCKLISYEWSSLCGLP